MKRKNQPIYSIALDKVIGDSAKQRIVFNDTYTGDSAVSRLVDLFNIHQGLGRDCDLHLSGYSRSDTYLRVRFCANGEFHTFVYRVIIKPKSK